VHVKRKKDEPIHVTIIANFKGSVHEYIGELKLSQDADRHQVEKKVSAILSSRANRLVEKLQQNKVDSLGIGMHVRNSMPYEAWKALDWSEEYPRVKVDCQIHFKAKDYGKIR